MGSCICLKCYERMSEIDSGDEVWRSTQNTRAVSSSQPPQLPTSFPSDSFESTVSDVEVYAPLKKKLKGRTTYDLEMQRLASKWDKMADDLKFIALLIQDFDRQRLFFPDDQLVVIADTICTRLTPIGETFDELFSDTRTRIRSSQKDLEDIIRLARRCIRCTKSLTKPMQKFIFKTTLMLFFYMI